MNFSLRNNIEEKKTLIEDKFSFCKRTLMLAIFLIVFKLQVTINWPWTWHVLKPGWVKFYWEHIYFKLKCILLCENIISVWYYLWWKSGSVVLLIKNILLFVPKIKICQAWRDAYLNLDSLDLQCFIMNVTKTTLSINKRATFLPTQVVKMKICCNMLNFLWRKVC